MCEKPCFTERGFFLQKKFWLAKKSYFCFVLSLNFIMSEPVLISTYLLTRKSLYDKVQSIDAIIEAMELKMADFSVGAASEHQDYSMDDGQVIVRTTYRSVSDFVKGIDALTKLKNKYLNQLHGNCIVLKDASTFR